MEFLDWIALITYTTGDWAWVAVGGLCPVDIAWWRGLSPEVESQSLHLQFLCKLAVVWKGEKGKFLNSGLEVAIAKDYCLAIIGDDHGSAY